MIREFTTEQEWAAEALAAGWYISTDFVGTIASVGPPPFTDPIGIVGCWVKTRGMLADSPEEYDAYLLQMAKRALGLPDET